MTSLSRHTSKFNNLKADNKDITRQTLHTKFYVSKVKNKRIRGGIRPHPKVQHVFKSPGKIGLMTKCSLCWSAHGIIQYVNGPCSSVPRGKLLQIQTITYNSKATISKCNTIQIRSHITTKHKQISKKV